MGCQTHALCVERDFGYSPRLKVVSFSPKNNPLLSDTLPKQSGDGNMLFSEFVLYDALTITSLVLLALIGAFPLITPSGRGGA